MEDFVASQQAMQAYHRIPWDGVHIIRAIFELFFLFRMKMLIYITSTFPLGGVTENSFITPELKYLSEKFDKIIFVPEHKEKECFDLNQYANLFVDDSYAKLKKRKSSIFLLFYLLKPIVWKSLWADRLQVNNKLRFLSLLSYVHNAYRFRQWLESKINKEQWDLDNTIFYTFWFHTETTGVALLSSKYNIKLVSRAHGYDIFDERVIFRSYYFRSLTLSKIHCVYTASKMGRDYLQNKFPQYAHKVLTSILGSNKENDKVSISHNSVDEITFFSCARLHPVKRIPLVLEFMISLATNYSKLKVQWIHVGDGEQMSQVKNRIQGGLPQNLHIRLEGVLENHDVHTLYITEQIDWSILLSESEGLPITIAESLSYGVPVIATSVGGIPEIVDDNVGILLSDNPEATEFLQKISEYIYCREKYNQLKKNALSRWDNNFRASKARASFAEKLVELIES